MAELRRLDFGRLKDVADTAGRKVADTANSGWVKSIEVADGVGQGIKKSADQTAATFTALGQSVAGRLQGKHKNGVDLSTLNTEAKLAYCRVLARLTLADAAIDPREIANLYLFATTIQLEPDARSILRSEVTAHSLSSGSEALADSAVRYAIALQGQLLDEDIDAVFAALVRDLLRIARADKHQSEEEDRLIAKIAEVQFGAHADDVIVATRALVTAEEDYLSGKISTGQLETVTKDVVAKAAAFSAPIAAVSLAGSVSGLGAAGITSGLAALGFGGLLGLNPMTTGIGAAVLLGVGVYAGTRWVLGINERERQHRREHLIQQVLKNHQQAIGDLTQDISGLASRMDEHLTQTTQNEHRLATLRADLAAFKLALASLQANRNAFEQGEPVGGQ
ncbi:TerB family tellurite resistance protein [Planctomonas deserti]|uniref:TerB family tellurite resistance protein n=1 Tax=Planctomonas deserti TaxID=2144185 RepID=UPI000D3C7FC0|nr:TerB family tellurite resistance protein [Planctomonas deserti]